MGLIKENGFIRTSVKLENSFPIRAMLFSDSILKTLILIPVWCGEKKGKKSAPIVSRTGNHVSFARGRVPNEREMRRPTTFAEVNNGRSFVRLVTVISRHCSLAEWFLVIHRYIYSVKVLFGCTSFAIIHRIELYPIIDTEYRVFIILLPSHLTDRVL